MKTLHNETCLYANYIISIDVFIGIAE